MDVKEILKSYNDLVNRTLHLCEAIEKGIKNRLERDNDFLLNKDFLWINQRYKKGNKIVSSLFNNPFKEEYVNIFGNDEFDGYVHLLNEKEVEIFGFTESDINGYGGSTSKIILPLYLLDLSLKESSSDFELLLEKYIDLKYMKAKEYLEELSIKEDNENISKNKLNEEKERELLKQLKEKYPN